MIQFAPCLSSSNKFNLVSAKAHSIKPNFSKLTEKTRVCFDGKQKQKGTLTELHFEIDLI